MSSLRKDFRRDFEDKYATIQVRFRFEELTELAEASLVPEVLTKAAFRLREAFDSPFGGYTFGRR